ncbi:MAG: hypothetical protein JSW13_01735 [Candidatus Aerophobus sp.]|nr:MAG: hypothetical protein JSW13_01735 [Candidatus Aerophobus sp.]
MEVIVRKSVKSRVKKVRQLLKQAGNTIGSVHFVKRSDGSLRKMCYRLHTYKPTYATKPSGKNFKARQAKNADKQMMTVLDVNKVRRDKKGRIAGRGDWRTIPLENVTRIKVKGMIYKIKST